MPSRWSSDVCSRSEEHTSELPSHSHLVCRLLLDKKKTECHLPRGPLDIENKPRDGETDKREPRVRVCVFLNDPAPTEIYPLSLHDALPICLNSSHTLISYAVFCLRDESVTGVQ